MEPELSSPVVALYDPERLAALNAFGPTATYRGSNVDRIVRLLAWHFEVPYSNALFVHPDRLSHFARYSGGEAETPLAQFTTGTDLSVAIVEQKAPVVVEDLRQHPVYSANPFVAASNGIRFFAGVPLCHPADHVVGIVCILDRKPHAFGPNDLAFLEDTAALVLDELNLLRQAQQLREAEARTREVLNATSSGFLALDDAGTITHLNHAAERILRRPCAALEGRTFAEVFPATDHPVAALFARTRAERTPTSFVGHFPALDVWLEVRIAPFEGGLSLYFDDVTTQHQLEREREQHREAVARNEQAFRTLAENLPSIVVRYDAELRVLYANPATRRVTGIRAEDLVGKHAGEPGTVSELLSDWVESLQAVLQSGRPLSRDLSLHRPGGATHFGTAMLVPETRPDGTVGSVLATIHDMTDFVVARQKLEASEEKYRTLSVLARTFAYTYVVPEGEPPLLDWITGSVEDVTGWPPGAFVDKPWGTMIDPRDRALSDARLAAVLRGETRTDDVRLVDANGEVRWLRLLIQPETDDRGRIVRLQGAGIDVTPHKEAEQALIHAKEQAEEVARLRDAFLANMSHEIRTPLTSVLGFADLLRDEVGEEHREYIAMIEAGGRRLQETLTSVLELSQLQSGHVTLHLELVDVRALSAETIRLLAPQAQARSLALSLEAPARLCPVRCDHRALGRVLTNLLGNALKFTNTGSITLRLHEHDGWLTLTVTDTGVGIAPAFLPYLFDDFRQESRGTTRTHEGAGLGLSITRRLVTLMGGTITAASEKDRGSTFTVRLPSAAPSDVPETAAAPALAATA